ncbi:NSFL1 cofactor p47-like [Tubulanus polymorphus]|uniref:NSFL1 cofactor p47-like n=1 Tax=Tubulanus polymorphus TaxID=672921 RepID=UPI003DA5DF0D
MADAEKSSKIEQFKNLTGVDDGRAQFYLESAAWHLEVAVESFYENDGLDGDDDDDVRVIPNPDPEDSPVTMNTSPQATRNTNRVTTFSSFQRNDQPAEGEEEGQMFYAGGSEHSGQAIVGPPRKKKQGSTADDLIQNMFKSAREHGAEDVGMDEAIGQKKRNKPTFKGAGYRLGETPDDSEKVSSGPVDEPQEIDVTITFWKDGFSVDDGPVRDFMDEANKPFLDSIARGEIPMELVRRAKGGEVNVNMVDKRTDEFTKPKKNTRAFTGEGRMLGSPCPAVAVTNTTSDKLKQNQDSAQSEISVDASQPTTQIQIRLSDGSRLVAKFNHTHSVGDIRRYICTARPEFASMSFVLMTAYPKNELTDNSVKINEANLLNAVIIQQMR